MLKTMFLLLFFIYTFCPIKQLGRGVLWFAAVLSAVVVLFKVQRQQLDQTTEARGWLTVLNRRTETPDAFPLLLSLSHKLSRKWGGRQDFVLLIAGQTAGFARESDERGGADVTGTWMPVFIRGLRGQRMAGAKAIPCWRSVWTWQK